MSYSSSPKSRNSKSEHIVRYSVILGILIMLSKFNLQDINRSRLWILHTTYNTPNINQEITSWEKARTLIPEIVIPEKESESNLGDAYVHEKWRSMQWNMSHDLILSMWWKIWNSHQNKLQKSVWHLSRRIKKETTTDMESATFGTLETTVAISVAIVLTLEIEETSLVYNKSGDPPWFTL